jgi:hypothetical protein
LLVVDLLLTPPPPPLLPLDAALAMELFKLLLLLLQ